MKKPPSDSTSAELSTMTKLEIAEQRRQLMLERFCCSDKLNKLCFTIKGPNTNGSVKK